MKQYSCSELITDFRMDDVEETYQVLSELTEKYDWHWEADLTKKRLEALKVDRLDYMFVMDKDGNDCHLEYGDNGYTVTGFRFDAEEHGITRNFPFLDRALEEIPQAELRAFDGGSTVYFEEWQDEH